MEDYKEISKEVYDRYAEEFNENTKDYLTKYIWKDAKLFIENLKGKKILDLGSGAGRDAIFFKERGLNPICVDISPKMIELCRKKGLNAEVMDMEDLKFEEGSFDGIWAYTSLLQIPKSRMVLVLDKIKSLLKREGIFYLGMKEGDFEGLIKSEKYGGMKRFFSLYSDNELRKLISENFDILHSSRVELGDATFLNYLCKKK